MKTFIALALDPALVGRLEVELKRLTRSAPGSKAVSTSSLHLTLAFLGEGPDALVPALQGVVEQVAKKYPPHVLTLKGTGTFGPMEAPKVLWVGIGGAIEPLNLLQKGVAQALAPLGLAPDHAVFHPHITLARTKAPRGDPALHRVASELRNTTFGELSVTHLTLFASEIARDGLRYMPLAHHPLTGRP